MYCEYQCLRQGSNRVLLDCFQVLVKIQYERMCVCRCVRIVVPEAGSEPSTSGSLLVPEAGFEPSTSGFLFVPGAQIATRRLWGRALYIHIRTCMHTCIDARYKKLGRYTYLQFYLYVCMNTHKHTQTHTPTQTHTHT
jgi:hypothetical protein